MKNCARCGNPSEDFGNATWCKPCYNEWRRGWRKRNPEKVKASKERALLRNPTALKAYDRKSYYKNRSRRILKSRLWNIRNNDRVAAREAARRASKSMATPRWANDFFIEEIYHLAALRTRYTGFKWNVDHVVPLQSKIVCGLHCEQNLQVIPAVKNISKGNRSWPGMP